jgi:hypothetical protein
MKVLQPRNPSLPLVITAMDELIVAPHAVCRLSSRYHVSDLLIDSDLPLLDLRAGDFLIW